MKTPSASTITAWSTKNEHRAQKPRRSCLLSACFLGLASIAPMPAVMAADKPLRVILSTDDASFSESYTNALAKAHADVVAIPEPDEAAFARADVVLMHRTQFRQLRPATLAALGGFAKKGGGIVAVNGAVAAGTAVGRKGSKNEDCGHHPRTCRKGSCKSALSKAAAQFNQMDSISLTSRSRHGAGCA